MLDEPNFIGKINKEGDIEYHVLDASHVVIMPLFDYNLKELKLFLSNKMEVILYRKECFFINIEGIDGILLISRAESKKYMTNISGIPEDLLGNNYFSYYYKGKLHRTNGPSLYCGEYKIYKENGETHRLDGPASFAFGKELYYVRGREIPEGLPKFKEGKIVNGVELTKSKIIEAMQFDREYGNFVKKMYEKKRERIYI